MEDGFARSDITSMLSSMLAYVSHSLQVMDR